MNRPGRQLQADTASRRSRNTPTTIWFRSVVQVVTKSRIRRSFGKGKSSQFELEELDSDLSNVLLCGIKGVNCVILTPRS